MALETDVHRGLALTSAVGRERAVITRNLVRQQTSLHRPVESVNCIPEESPRSARNSCSPSSRRMAGVPTEQTERTTTASQLCCTAQRRDHLQAIVEFPRGKLLSNLRYAIVLPYNFLVSIPSFRVILTASFRFLIVGAMRRQTASEACWYPDRRRQTHWNCNWYVWRRCPSHGNSG